MRRTVRSLFKKIGKSSKIYMDKLSTAKPVIGALYEETEVSI